jgi:hypothetical protein
MHLDGILEVHNHVGMGVDLLTCKVKLLMGEVPPMLGLTKAVICGLLLQVHFHTHVSHAGGRHSHAQASPSCVM